MRLLVRDCPGANWRLCPYLDQFPAAADLFLWRADGPIARAGGAKLVSAEANAIVEKAIAAEPIEELHAGSTTPRSSLPCSRLAMGLTPGGVRHASGVG
jgi:hypothetical protein